MVYKVRCHGEVREGGALKSPLHLAIRRSFGGRGESNFREVVMRGNTGFQQVEGLMGEESGDGEGRLLSHRGTWL